jgi:UV DNA damage repair endonuclease
MIEYQQYKFNSMEFNVSNQFKEWYRKYDDSEKCRLVKEKSIQVNNAHKRFVKALKAEQNSSSVRVAKQHSNGHGGKMASLSTQTSRTAKTYQDLSDELKYMVAVL